MTDNADEVPPSPSRLVESLRDTGYSYQAAFADVVDNSVAAGATHVSIDIDESIFGGDVVVTFIDNGSGMDEATLRESMRYGSKKRPSPKSLGKFGMGLKTASTAFCRRLVVITKKDTTLNARSWDIDAIIESDRWVLTTPDLSEYSEQVDKLNEISEGGSGTIVRWEKVDRLISASGRDYSSQALNLLTEEIRDHLAATFGKFLIGREAFANGTSRTPSPDIKIELNGVEISGWDPTGQFLNSDDDAERVLSEKTRHSMTLVSNGESVTSQFEVNGYVLPNRNKMSDEELKAVRFSNDNQGFYIYREDRLIFGGGWPHRLFSQDSHQNLLRVELNFNHELDDYFEIDIRKSKINLPVKMRDELKNLLSPWRNEASRRYRINPSNPAKPTDPVPRNPHTGSSPAIKRQLGNSQNAKLLSYDAGTSTVKIENGFGETEINRAAIVEGTDIFVATVSTIDGGMLWQIDMMENGSTVVVLNESHEFYRRFYLSPEVTPIIVQAMDSLFWSLANSEVTSITDIAKRNFEELRFNISNSLRNLASELPDVE